MSLFPAYTKSEPETSAVSEDKQPEEESTDASSWLVNPSFSVKVSQFSLPSKTSIVEFPKENKPDIIATSVEQEETVTNLSPSSEEDHKNKDSETSECVKREESPKYNSRKKSSKHKKHKSQHKHKRRKYDDDKDEKVYGTKEEKCYYEDKIREIGNLKVSTLSRPAIPLYSLRRDCSLGAVGWINISKKKKKKKRQLRYHTHLSKFYDIDAEDNKEEQEMTNNINKDTKEKDENIETPADHRLEEELSKNTAHYNKSLAEQPSNIELWLKYARFQDTVWQFEKTYRRGGGARGARVTAERKLAILDKALQHNPESDILLKERIAVAEAIFPADTLSRQLGDMLEKQPGQLALWHGYVGATQCSLALCTVPAVSKLYNQAMERLHQLRRGTPASQTRSTEEKILALLFDCGLFLRQAGLWEQLWLLLRLYLELNMSKPESSHFKIESTLPEQLLTEAEERILASNLPLTELWLRVEQLREGAHWVPWASDEECEDPQRLVFSDDVSDLLHPITTPSLLPNLAALTLTLLKVPLLPCRDTGLHVIVPHVKSWSFDSVEMLLPALFPMGTVDLDCGELLKDITKLSVGPQYLEQRLGQEHYLEFVVKVFHLCADCLPEPARTAFCIWWLRFERLLLVLDRLGISKLAPARKKKLKSTIKDFLKQERNRNCLHFYREYALIEWELGHHDGACKILETAISAQPGGLPVVSVLNEHERAGLGSLYRTLSELYLCRSKFSSEDASVNKQKAISTLMALALGKPISKPENSSVPELQELVAVSEKYHHVGTELLEITSDVVSTVSEQLLPDFCVDWISCNAWLIFVTHSAWAAGALLEDILKKVPRMNCRREALFEVYVNILHHHCEESPGTYSVLRDVLHRALKEFPSSLYFLTTAAKLQTCTNGIGSPWWKLRGYFTEADSLMARIFLVLLARQRYKQHQILDVDSHNFLQTAGPIVSDGSSLNLLRALFTQLEQQDLTKQCPLIWRLYLRFLYDHGSEGSCKTGFYRAIEVCPWVKALYIDASMLVPEEQPRVQDLIIEKELRLHVTPEELDILRSVPP